MIDVETLHEEVVGARFPDGSFTIPAHEAWLTADALHAPGLPDGIAHPMYVYYAGIVGMGLTLDELFAMVHAAADDGPMFGELQVDQRRPLRVGESFTVRGEITDVVRKRGGSGTFDIVTFTLDLLDERDELAGSTTNAFVFPRRP